MTTTTFPSAAAPAKSARRRVVDAPTRVFHWLFALSFLGAYLTAEGERLRLLHVTLGYTMAGLLVFRVLYGLLGPRQAALSMLWRKLGGLWPWAQSLKAAVQADASPAVNWRQGQNLFMALAIVALLVLVLPLTLSGYATYNEWGDFLGGDWIEEVHEFFGNTVLAVVLAHIAAIVGLSVLRRKNLAAQMVTGRADGPGPDLAKRNHGWLAALLLCAVLTYWTWEWQQSPQGLISPQAISAVLSGQGDDEDD
ncbi:cytochrome b/b6 domain-containing protein [Rhodoferax sp.]|uniref:cytochrome b/b6 domain-containing protein n=1 Tax=Rhodoferax sp. TaxID=50421 RepID=UPI002ACD2586|nr:cytochrome b/b6 domain-containing protein [Rhodoferax sp.]MDZ7922362.1 cytochrome b/b6 domain-containing protein [Rhodoferax sp.]